MTATKVDKMMLRLYIIIYFLKLNAHYTPKMTLRSARDSLVNEDPVPDKTF